MIHTCSSCLSIIELLGSKIIIYTVFRLIEFVYKINYLPIKVTQPEVRLIYKKKEVATIRFVLVMGNHMEGEAQKVHWLIQVVGHSRQE